MRHVLSRYRRALHASATGRAPRALFDEVSRLRWLQAPPAVFVWCWVAVAWLNAVVVACCAATLFGSNSCAVASAAASARREVSRALKGLAARRFDRDVFARCASDAALPGWDDALLDEVCVWCRVTTNHGVVCYPTCSGTTREIAW